MSMKTIRQVSYAFLAAILLFPASAAAGSGEDAPDAAVLTAMLHAFLSGASQNDPASVRAAGVHIVQPSAIWQG